MALAAGERLELFIGLGDAVTTHDGLDGFSKHFPGGIEVFSNACGVKFKFSEASAERRIAHEAVAEGHTEVAEHRGVGEVTLPA